MLAKNARKPFYAAGKYDSDSLIYYSLVLAESFKFLRMFPLGQYDLPIHKPSSLSLAVRNGGNSAQKEEAPECPSVDYTPPEYITLLLTDLGVLTPSGVSDELIKLYF